MRHTKSERHHSSEERRRRHLIRLIRVIIYLACKVMDFIGTVYTAFLAMGALYNLITENKELLLVSMSMAVSVFILFKAFRR